MGSHIYKKYRYWIKCQFPKVYTRNVLQEGMNSFFEALYVYWDCYALIWR